MVGTVGLEPTRDFSQRILSPLRLPIPPRPHIGGSDRICTDDHRVAVYCLTAWLRNQLLRYYMKYRTEMQELFIFVVGLYFEE